MQVSPRKNPRQQRSAATRDFILEAAAHILAREGLAGYNTNAIAAHAGVSIGSLYQYFPNKESITATLLIAMHQEMVRHLRQVLADTCDLPFPAALRLLVERVVTEQLANPRLDRVLEVEEERLPKSDEVRALEAEIRALNQEFLSRYLDRARLSPAEIAEISADMVCVVGGMMERALNRANPQAGREALIERLLALLGGYLGPHVAPRRDEGALRG